MNAKQAIKAVVFLSIIGICGLSSAAILSPGDILVADLGSDPYGTIPGGILKVDPATGDREVITGFGVGSGPSIDNPTGIAIDKEGHIIVLDVTKDSVFRVDAITGVRTLISGPGLGIGPTLASPLGIAIEQNGNLLVSTALSHFLCGPDFCQPVGDILRIDLTTGDRTIVSSGFLDIGTGPALGAPFDIAFDTNGQLLVLDTSAFGSILRIDPLTGDRATVSGSGVGLGPSFNFDSLSGIPQGIAVNENGQILVSDPGQAAILSVEPVSGERSIVSGLGSGSGINLNYPAGIATGDGGEIFVVDVNEAALLSIDPVTGDRVFLAADDVGLGQSLSFPTYIAVVPVPEPSSVILLGSGALLILATRLQRRVRRRG